MEAIWQKSSRIFRRQPKKQQQEMTEIIDKVEPKGTMPNQEIEEPRKYHHGKHGLLNI